MSELYMMTAIITRDRTRYFSAIYDRQGVPVTFITLGHATAKHDIPVYLGLDSTDKAVIFFSVSRNTGKKIKTGL